MSYPPPPPGPPQNLMNQISKRKTEFALIPLSYSLKAVDDTKQSTVMQKTIRLYQYFRLSRYKGKDNWF